jgi:heme/copper-type cytochrome/quinol oxidase subunit 2
MKDSKQMTMKTKIHKNEEFDKWLAQWTKENQQSGVGADRLTTRKEDSKINNVPCSQPRKENPESVMDNRDRH